MLTLAQLADAGTTQGQRALGPLNGHAERRGTLTFTSVGADAPAQGQPGVPPPSLDASGCGEHDFTIPPAGVIVGWENGSTTIFTLQVGRIVSSVFPLAGLTCPPGASPLGGQPIGLVTSGVQPFVITKPLGVDSLTRRAATTVGGTDAITNRAYFPDGSVTWTVRFTRIS
jgi:hypothetical protein